jgi:hypothetical protein
MRRCYAIVRTGGSVDFVWCYPEEIACLKEILQGFVIGEGRDKQQAKMDALQSGLWAH